MKDKQKSLEDLGFVTELAMSELEGINGGASEVNFSGDLTADVEPVPISSGRPSTPQSRPWSWPRPY